MHLVYEYYYICKFIRVYIKKKINHLKHKVGHFCLNL